MWTLPQTPARTPDSSQGTPPGFSQRPGSGATQTSGSPDLGVPRALPTSPAQQLTWVPLPAPGGPRSTARMPSGDSLAGSAMGTLGAMAAEISRCSTSRQSSQVHRFQASAPRTPRTPRSPFTLARRHVRQPTPPTPESDGNFLLPTTQRYWGRLLLIGQNR